MEGTNEPGGCPGSAGNSAGSARESGPGGAAGGAGVAGGEEGEAGMGGARGVSRGRLLTVAWRQARGRAESEGTDSVAAVVGVGSSSIGSSFMGVWVSMGAMALYGVDSGPSAIATALGGVISSRAALLLATLAQVWRCLKSAR